MRVLLGVLAFLLFSRPAFGGPKEDAKAHYQKGRTQYDLGNFPEAVKEFEKAYVAFPAPAFLFDIAQTYRQNGETKKALFFYKRFLAVATEGRERRLAEQAIEELEKQLERGERPKRLCADEEGLELLIKACKQAHQKDPKPRYLYNLAWAYEQKGDLRQAIAYYKKYLALDPKAGNRTTVEQTIAALKARLSRK